MNGTARKHLQGVAHRGKIGRDIDGIGDQQQSDNAVQQPGGIVVANVGGKPANEKQFQMKILYF